MSDKPKDIDALIKRAILSEGEDRGFAAEEKICAIVEQLREENERLENQNQMTELSRTLDVRLSEVPKAIQAQFSESAKIIREVTGELTKVSEGQKQVISLTDQLRGLEDILKNPKQRGILGEYFLEETLRNVLPPNSYQMQYKFTDGKTVDAVVFVKDKIIPVDSKFSLENYERLLNERDPVLKIELEKQFKTPHIGNINRVEELKQILSQSTPLIPEIEKAFDAGNAYCVGSHELFEQSHPNKENYISNLKLIS